ncbi:MAG: DUF1549 domain-containing protein [Planctomycetota bacterium]
MRWLALAIPLGLVLSFSGNDGRGVASRRTAPERTAALGASIDSRLAALWRERELEPAAQVDALTFARRLWLDLLGTIPSLEELRELERVPEGERREWLIARALADPRFDEVLAERLARIAVGGKDTKQDDLIYRRRRLVAWLSAQVRRNRGWDELVRDLLTAQGLSTDAPATNFTVSQDGDPLKLAARTTRAFLGLRIDCAQCHDHPFTHWKQRDFEGLAAYFARVRRNLAGVREAREGELEFQLPAGAGMGMGMAMGGAEGPPQDPTHQDYGEGSQEGEPKEAQPAEIQPKETDSKETDSKLLLVKAPFGQPVLLVPGAPRPPAAEVRLVSPRVPFAKELLGRDAGTRRQALAAWVTSPENPYFARALVNRFWQWLLGRGIVEPVDELDTSKPRDRVLLELLASDFRASGHDLRHLVRAIVSTRAYASSSASARDDPEAALAVWALRPLKALRGDQLGRAVIQSGSLRAYDRDRQWLLRLASWGGANDFVKRHADDLALEEPEEETLLQRLHLLNGKQVHEVTQGGPFNPASRLPFLAPDDAVALDAAFLITLTRRPTPEEREHFGGLLRDAGPKGDARSEVMSDLLWCLVNTTEFAWSR